MSDNLGTAVVTGASSGIGAVYAQRLAARGYDLLLVARRVERLEKLAADLRGEFGVKVEFLGADLSKAGDVRALANRLRTDERITLLVNNAGLAYMSPSVALTADHAQQQIDVNVTALTQLSLAVLPRFTEKNAGTLINISSVLSVFALPSSTTYSGTKAYVTLFTQGLQQELKDTHIRIQAVLPAATATEIWDQVGGHGVLQAGTVMTAENCVDAALAGLDASEAITFPSLEDASLWSGVEQARLTLPPAVSTGKPASRYALNG